jgi:hypothetical protein
VRGALAPNTDESLTVIDNLYFSRGGYTREQVDEAGRLLMTIVEEELMKSIRGATSSRVRGSVRLNDGLIFTSRPIQAGAQYKEGGRHLDITFHSAPPFEADAERQYDLFLPKDAGGEDDVQLKQLNGEDTFAARMDEITRANSGVLHIRAAIFAERVVAELLAKLGSKAATMRQGHR